MGDFRYFLLVQTLHQIIHTINIASFSFTAHRNPVLNIIEHLFPNKPTQMPITSFNITRYFFFRIADCRTGDHFECLVAFIQKDTIPWLAMHSLSCCKYFKQRWSFQCYVIHIPAPLTSMLWTKWKWHTKIALYFYANIMNIDTCKQVIRAK